MGIEPLWYDIRGGDGEEGRSIPGTRFFGAPTCCIVPSPHSSDFLPLTCLPISLMSYTRPLISRVPMCPTFAGCQQLDPPELPFLSSESEDSPPPPHAIRFRTATDCREIVTVHAIGILSLTQQKPIFTPFKVHNSDPKRVSILIGVNDQSRPAYCIECDPGIDKKHFL